MVAAYKAGPKNEATNSRVETTMKNMENGCGTDQVDKLRAALEEAGVTPSGAPGDAEADPSANECEAKGISGDSVPRRERKEGTCLDPQGVRLKVVNKNTKLTLKQLDVAYGAFQTAQTLTASTGTEKANGIYCSVTLTVTNKLDSPVSFDGEQVILSIGDKSYTPDFDAGNMPGNSLTGTTTRSSRATPRRAP